MDYKETYRFWCANEYFDESTRTELKNIAGDEKEIEDRFYRDLEFGTGGLRGVIGAGTNRMNVYTVRKATQGRTLLLLKMGRIKGWPLLLIREICLRSSQEKLRSALMLMGLKRTVSIRSGRRRSYPLPFGSLDVLPVL